MPKLRLFCFPYGGAGASGYRAWGRSLPEGVEIVPVNFPGRENRFREEPYTHIDPLLAELTRTLDFTSGPFGLFGHSLGALVAFHLARELRRQGKPAPAVLVVSGYPAPTSTATGPTSPICRTMSTWRCCGSASTSPTPC
jgi:surfactin synthase thioesterase subunit